MSSLVLITILRELPQQMHEYRGHFGDENNRADQSRGDAGEEDGAGGDVEAVAGPPLRRMRIEDRGWRIDK